MFSGLCIALHGQQAIKTQKLSEDGTLSMTIFNSELSRSSKVEINSVFKDVLKMNDDTTLNLVKFELGEQQLKDEKFQQF